MVRILRIDAADTASGRDEELGMSRWGRRVFGAFGACAAVLALATQAQAATYHVRPDGSDSNCNGLTNASDASTTTSSCAFLTVQKAVNTWSGTGNTVLLHAGTINGSGSTGSACVTSGPQSPSAVYVGPTKGVAAGAYNVLKAANDGTVNLSANNGTCDLTVWIDAPYIQIGGLGAGEGLTFPGDNTFAFAASFARAVGTVTFRNASHDGRVYGCNFLKNLSTNIPASDVGIGQIKANTGSGQTGYHFAGNTVRLGNIGKGIGIDNPGTITAVNCDGTGDDSWPAGIIENNVILHDSVDSTNNFRKQAFGGEMTKDVIYRNNYVRFGSSTDVGTGAIGHEWYAFPLRASCRQTIQNNYIEVWSDSSDAFGVWNFKAPDGAGNTNTNQRYKVYNNTIYGKGKIGIYMNSCGGCEVRNNVVIGGVANGWPESVRDGACTTESSGPRGYNAYYNSAVPSVCSTSTNEGHNVAMASAGMSLSGARPVPFFQLTAGSALIGAGTITGAPATDFDGVTRSIPYDIGADEFGVLTTCGNGVRDTGESCDGGALGGSTCVSLGFSGGTLVCTASCTFNTAGCDSAGNTPPPTVTNVKRTDQKP